MLSYFGEGPRDGPCVVLQHALTASASSFVENGTVGALTEAGFRCVLPEALGHGCSSLVPSFARHGLAERSKDVLAVMDHAGIKNAAFAGYSMGAWIGTGLLASAPERFMSFSLAGWDLLNGARDFTRLTSAAERREEFVQLVRSLSVGALRPPSSQQVEGYLDTYARLFDDLPQPGCLMNKRPVAIAIGRGDPYAPSCRKAAEQFGASLDVLPGDHISSFWSLQYREHLLTWVMDLISPEV